MTPFNINPALQLVNLGSLFGSRLLPAGGIDISFPQIPPLRFDLAWLGLGNMGSPWRVADQYYGGGYGGLPGGGFKGIGSAPAAGEAGEGQGQAAGVVPPGMARREELQLPNIIRPPQRERPGGGRELAAVGRPREDKKQPAQARAAQLPKEVKLEGWEEWLKTPFERAGKWFTFGLAGSAATASSLFSKYVIEPVEQRITGWLDTYLNPRLVASRRFLVSWLDLYDQHQNIEKELFDRITSIDKGTDTKAYKTKVIETINEYLKNNTTLNDRQKAAIENMKDAIDKLPPDLVADLVPTRRQQVNDIITKRLTRLSQMNTSSGDRVLDTHKIIEDILGSANAERTDWSSVRRSFIERLKERKENLESNLSTVQGKNKIKRDQTIIETLDTLIKQLEVIDDRSFAYMFGEDIREKNPALYLELQRKAIENSLVHNTIRSRVAAGGMWLSRHFIHSTTDPLGVFFASLEFVRELYKPEGDVRTALGAASLTLLKFALGSLPADLTKTVFFGGRNIATRLIGWQFFENAESQIQRLMIRSAGMSFGRFAPRWTFGFALRTFLGMTGYLDPVSAAITAVGFNLVEQVGDAIRYDQLYRGSYNPALYGEMLLDAYETFRPKSGLEWGVNVLFGGPFYWVYEPVHRFRKYYLKEEAERFHKFLENMPHAYKESILNLYLGCDVLPDLFVGLKPNIYYTRNHLFDEILWTAFGRKVQEEQMRNAAMNAMLFGASFDPVAAAAAMAAASANNAAAMHAIHNMGILDVYRNFDATRLGTASNLILNVADQFGRTKVLDGVFKELSLLNYKDKPQLALLEYVELLKEKQQLYLLGIQSLQYASDGSGYRLFLATFETHLKELEDRLKVVRSHLPVDLGNANKSAEELKKLAMNLVPQDLRDNVSRQLSQNDRFRHALINLVNLDQILNNIDLDNLGYYRYQPPEGEERNFVNYIEKFLKNKEKEVAAIKRDQIDILNIIFLNSAGRQQDIIRHINELQRDTTYNMDDTNFDKHRKMLSTVMQVNVLKELGVLAANGELVKKSDQAAEILRTGINNERLSSYIFSASDRKGTWEKLIEISAAFELIVGKQEEHQRASEEYIKAENAAINRIKALQAKVREGQQITNEEKDEVKKLEDQLQIAAQNLRQKYEIVESFDDLLEGKIEFSKFAAELRKSNTPLAREYQKLINDKLQQVNQLTNTAFDQEYQKALSLINRTDMKLSENEQEYLNNLAALGQIDRAANKEDIITSSALFLLHKIKDSQKQMNDVDLKIETRAGWNGQAILWEKRNEIFGNVYNYLQNIHGQIKDRVQSPVFGFNTMQYRQIPPERLWQYTVNILLDNRNPDNLYSYIDYLQRTLPADAAVRGSHAIPNLLTVRTLTQYASTSLSIGDAFDLNVRAAFAVSAPHVEFDYRIETFRGKWLAASQAMKSVQAVLDDVRGMDTQTSQKLTSLMTRDINTIIAIADNLNQQARGIVNDMTIKVEETKNKNTKQELRKSLDEFIKNINPQMRKDMSEFIISVVAAAHHGKINSEIRKLSETKFTSDTEIKTFYHIAMEVQGLVNEIYEARHNLAVARNDAEAAKALENLQRIKTRIILVREDLERFSIPDTQKKEDLLINKKAAMLKNTLSDYLYDIINQPDK
jgi:hypothetical protein